MNEEVPQIVVPFDDADAMEAAIQFWHAALIRFAEQATSGDLRIFFDGEVKDEQGRLITALRSPAYVARWKTTVGSLMVTLPDADRALTRNRVLVANARARALTSQRIDRRRAIGLPTAR